MKFGKQQIFPFTVRGLRCGATEKVIVQFVSICFKAAFIQKLQTGYKTGLEILKLCCRKSKFWNVTLWQWANNCRRFEGNEAVVFTVNNPMFLNSNFDHVVHLSCNAWNYYCSERRKLNTKLLLPESHHLKTGYNHSTVFKSDYTNLRLYSFIRNKLVRVATDDTSVQSVRYQAETIDVRFVRLAERKSMCMPLDSVLGRVL